MINWPKTGWWSQLARTMKRWKQDDGNLLAAAMAYYAALSFFPLLLILVAVLGIVLSFSSGAQDAEEQLLRMLADSTSTALAAHVESALTDIRAKAVIGGPLGLITLLLAGIGIFTQFEVAFDRIWNLGKKRPKGIIAAVRHVLFHRLRAFLMLVGLGFLVLAAFVAGIAASAVRTFVTDLPGGRWTWILAHIAASVTVNWLLFTIIYKVVPRVRIRWSDAARGGVLAAVLWEAARQLLTVFLVSKKYTAYGVVGSLMVLMLWIYIAAGVVLLAAEYVRVLCDARGEREAITS